MSSPVEIIQISSLQKRYERNEFRPSLRHEASSLIRSIFGGPNSNTEIDPFFALKDVTFNVERGERVAIVGLNGSGKTTLLRVVAGITQPTSGSVKVNGNFVSLIGLGAGFIPTLSGTKNIYLNAAIHGVSKAQIDNLVKPIVRFAELEEFIDLPTNRYSSGMLARLGFSIAIHILPELVLVDEVLAVGDAAFQQKCMQRIKKVFTGSRTFVLVSHASDTIKDLCDRTIWLHHGLIMQDGPTNIVLPSYLAFIEQIRKEREPNLNPSIEPAQNSD